MSLFQNFSLVIPHRPDHGQRDRVTTWVLNWWDRNASGIQLILADSDAGQPFSRSQARNRGIDKATRPYLCIADADSIVDDYWLRLACQQTMDTHEQGDKQWILPYSIYYNVNESFTERILTEGEHVILERVEYDHKIPSPTSPPAVSGINVLPRECVEAVGGYDERFIGWGYEDSAQAVAYNTMWGPVHRTPGNCYHLWHPVAPGTTFDGDHIQKNRRLHQRYLESSSSQSKMGKLLEGKP